MDQNESIHNPENAFEAPMNPDMLSAAEFLKHQQEQGKSRETAKINRNDVGVTKAAAEMFAEAKNAYKLDSESNAPTGLNLEQQRAVLNNLLDSAAKTIDHPDLMEPNDMIEKILKPAIEGE